MDYKYLIFSVKEKVAYITLNRPDAMNSFSLNMKHELEDAVSQIEKDDSVWGVIITGNGRAFSAGTDISGFPSTVEEARKVTKYSQALFNRIENIEKPVIAALNGFALGGGLELALVCDIRIANEKVKLGLPEVKICAIPCYGGTQRLTRMIGAGRTKELVFTGKMMLATEAVAIGLINHVVPVGEELAKAEEIMAEILKNAPMAVAYAKACINRGPEIGLEYALHMEETLVSMLIPTEDLAEGKAAFMEKREPVFKNR